MSRLQDRWHHIMQSHCRQLSPFTISSAYRCVRFAFPSSFCAAMLHPVQLALSIWAPVDAGTDAISFRQFFRLKLGLVNNGLAIGTFSIACTMACTPSDYNFHY
jgi:hypothetical protein